MPTGLSLVLVLYPSCCMPAESCFFGAVQLVPVCLLLYGAPEQQGYACPTGPTMLHLRSVLQTCSHYGCRHTGLLVICSNQTKGKPGQNCLGEEKVGPARVIQEGMWIQGLQLQQVEVCGCWHYKCFTCTCDCEPHTWKHTARPEAILHHQPIRTKRSRTK